MVKNYTCGFSGSRIAIRLGAIAWLSSIQYFFVQLWVVSNWPKPYNPGLNFISDLGNTACGIMPANIQNTSRYICSPEHHWMNASFLLLGITTSIGALLLRSRLLPGPLGLIATALFIASGIGIAMVGLNPENLQIIKHIVGAYLNAYGASFAIILAGICLIKNEVNRKVGLLSFWTGIMLLILNASFVIGYYYSIPIFSLGLGVGGIEKLCNYPIFLWFTLIGLYFLIKTSPVNFTTNEA